MINIIINIIRKLMDFFLKPAEKPLNLELYNREREIVDKKIILRSLIVHHTAGALMKNADPQSVRDSLNDCGFDRGYKVIKDKNGKVIYRFNRTDREQFGQVIPYDFGNPDKLNFSMYHFAVYPYTKNNPSGWKCIQLIRDPVYYDVGSTENQQYNRHAMSICFLGNYVNNMIDQSALQVAANSLKNIVDYAGGELVIIPHKEIDPTECPGKISEQLHAFKLMLFR